MNAKLMKETVDVPQGITVNISGSVVKLKGPKGELTRELRFPKIEIESKDGKIEVRAKDATKKEKTIIGTYAAHLKNMVIGVSEGYTYTLKVCSGHFPMNVAIIGKVFSVKNFLGEKIPRELIIKDGVTVKLEGDIIAVESIDKELAGQVAGAIEILTRVSGKDRRIFQDGIYITQKGNKKIE